MKSTIIKILLIFTITCYGNLLFAKDNHEAVDNNKSKVYKKSAIKAGSDVSGIVSEIPNKGDGQIRANDGLIKDEDKSKKIKDNNRLIIQDVSYKIGQGDILEISVWMDENLTKQIIVPPDGVISFPLIGDTNISGLNISGLRDIIKAKLMEYLPDPTVTVMLIAPNSLTAYVIGKVNKPGQFPITLNTNIIQILSMAGGMNPYASPNKIIILRKANGKDIKIPFNYNQVKKGKKLEQNIILRRGDVVIVP